MTISHEHTSELKNALEQISYADKVKNDFLSILAHELRNPLSPVLSSLELLKTDCKENKKTLILIEVMETHLYIMSSILDELLNISKLSHNTFELEKSIKTAKSKIINRQNTSKVPSKKYKIIVVDDNINAADMMSELLRHNGHIVKTAYDGLSALEIISVFKPEVVVLDIGMPGMDGYEVAKTISETALTLTLIALTGYSQETDKLKAKESGFDYHLTKPVSVFDIEKILINL